MKRVRIRIDEEIEFDHSADTVSKALGISDERMREILHMGITMFLTAGSISEFLERVWINNELSLPEKIFLTYSTVLIRDMVREALSEKGS